MGSMSKQPILFIVAGLISVIFMFNNCGAGFEGLSEKSAIDTNVGTVGFGPTPLGKLNVVTVNSDGSTIKSEKDYFANDGEVYLDGLNIGSTEVLKPGDTFYQKEPANSDAQKIQNSVIEEMSYVEARERGGNALQALKIKNSTEVWQGFRDQVFQNRVLYVDNSSAWYNTILGYINTFNQEMENYSGGSINFKIEGNKSGRYPKLRYFDLNNIHPNSHYRRRHGISFYASLTLWEQRHPGVEVYVDGLNGGVLTYRDFVSSVLKTMGYYYEHERTGASQHIGYSPSSAKIITIGSDQERMSRYSKLSEGGNFDTSAPIDFDSIMMDPSHRFNALGSNFGNEQAVIYRKSNGLLIPPKNNLSQRDLRGLLDYFGVKQPTNVLVGDSLSVKQSIHIKNGELVDGKLFNLSNTVDNHNLKVISFKVCIPSSLIRSNQPPSVKLARYWPNNNGGHTIKRQSPIRSVVTNIDDCSSRKGAFYLFKAPVVSGATPPLNLYSQQNSGNKFDKVFLELDEPGYSVGTSTDPLFAKINNSEVNTYSRFVVHRSGNSNSPGNLWVFNMGGGTTRYFIRINERVRQSPTSNNYNYREGMCEVTSTDLNRMLNSDNSTDSNNVIGRINNESKALYMDNIEEISDLAFGHYFMGDCSTEEENIGRHTLLTALGVNAGNPPAPVNQPAEQNQQPAAVTGNLTYVGSANSSKPVCDDTAVDLTANGYGWLESISKTCVIECGEAYKRLTTAHNCSSNVGNNSSQSNGNTGNAGTCVDSDGDGWGWDGVASCRVTTGGGNSGGNNSPACIDSDGDGFGWNGTAVCLP